VFHLAWNWPFLAPTPGFTTPRRRLLAPAGGAGGPSPPVLLPEWRLLAGLAPAGPAEPVPGLAYGDLPGEDIAQASRAAVDLLLTALAEAPVPLNPEDVSRTVGALDDLVREAIDTGDGGEAYARAYRLGGQGDHRAGRGVDHRLVPLHSADADVVVCELTGRGLDDALALADRAGRVLRPGGADRRPAPEDWGTPVYSPAADWLRAVFVAAERGCNATEADYPRRRRVEAVGSVELLDELVTSSWATVRTLMYPDDDFLPHLREAIRHRHLGVWVPGDPPPPVSPRHSVPRLPPATGPVAGVAAQPPARKKGTKVHQRATKEKEAIAYLWKNLSASKTDIARAIGVHRSTLDSYPEFKIAYRSAEDQARAGRDAPRGGRAGGEFWRYNDKDDPDTEDADE
jgi:hypothetical protein